MQGVRPKIKPLSAGRSSGSPLDEVSQLELHLQRQLEDDVARIFDESIYSDLEVACGKFKILTHSCILKARTHTFYHKLETVLRVDIGRKTFDEIYSFISDIYTECDIQHQENEIIDFLNENLKPKPATVCDKRNKHEELEESDVYATPNCASPEDGSLQKTLSSSPSTELTKEYYALVPLEGRILDKELIEQDQLSTAFQSFIQLRNDTLKGSQSKQCIKPTTLSLNSSHTSKINKHSIICDISKDIDYNNFLLENDNNKIKSVTSQVRKHISDINKSTQVVFKKAHSADTGTYSPDSLIADEPSSSSEYLSAAHSVSPGAASSSYFSHAPAEGTHTVMNKTFTISDSGFDNNGMLDSLNSHKDVTLTDLSLTESTIQDLLNDRSVCHNPTSEPIEKKQSPKAKFGCSQPSLTSAYKSSLTEMSGRSCKEEKQHVKVLESSSLSSEAGSWESVFPPNMPEKDICKKFLNIERQNFTDSSFKIKTTETSSPNVQFPEIVQKASYPTSCFIDAASLADEEVRHQDEIHYPFPVNTDNIYRSSSRPVPCVPKQDISPIDFSEGNDNEDSLEQADPDSIQKDISPTIFEMVLVSEDSAPVENTSEFVNEIETQNLQSHPLPVLSTKLSNDVNNSAAKSDSSPTVYAMSTPNNSIISLKAFKKFDSKESDNDAILLQRETTVVENMKKRTSLGQTVRQDIQLDDFNTSPMPKRKIENIPIVSGAHIYREEDKPDKTSKASSYAPAWVVDMSKVSLDPNSNTNNTKPGDRTCNSLKASSVKFGSNSDVSKSRTSEDDTSEKSAHKFYIDLSTLPDTLAPEPNFENEANEKKPIFSMFIDLGDKCPAVKEMPAWLSSSLTTKKNKFDNKSAPAKAVKTVENTEDIVQNTKDTFENLESLCNDPDISILEILKNPDNDAINRTTEENTTATEIKDYSRGFSREGIKTSIEEEPGDDESCGLFVKLSDLDKPVAKNDSTLISRPDAFERMTRSIPDNNSNSQLKNWGESSNPTSRSIYIISSFHSENALSLNRLFPHLKNDISRSMPGSLSGRTRSPLRLGVSSTSVEREDLVSSVSEISSVQSSMCRSVIENSTTEDTSQTSSLISNCQSRLGQDLLRMFLEEIAPDVIVEVSGRRIKAHKCILSSRCQYFAGILSGGWVESAGNVIALPSFSFSVAHFALCHIYSGVSMIPESISIAELATIADMLGLEGLKEAIMFTLKVKYCHHFHRPCEVCIVGVLECFPLSSVYGLDDLYRRCLRWITKHFRKVWPTKAFATLPSELLEKCYQEQILNLTTNNIIDTVYDIGLTVVSVHRSRWAEVVAQVCRRVVRGAGVWAGARLSSVVRVMADAPAEAAPPAAHALDQCLAAAVENATPDELCRAYGYLCTLSDLPNEPAVSLAHARAASLRRQCEAAIGRASPRVTDTCAFRELPVDRRRRLRELIAHNVNRISFLQPPSVRKPEPKKYPNGLDERVRACLLTRQAAESRAFRPPPPERVEVAAPPRVRTTKAQEKRAEFNITKSAAAKPSTGRIVKTRSTRNIASAKPRYLEPRTERKKPGKMPSSSEESRNSSPVLAGRKPAPATRRVPYESRESLASRPRTAGPSSNFVSETLKYATYTKTTHTAKGTVPSMPPSKCYPTPIATNRPRTTKIPVYLNRKHPTAKSTTTLPKQRSAASSHLSQRTRNGEAKPSGSLMMATKSSSAKMVPKAIKESSKSAKHAGFKPAAAARDAPPSLPDVPVMERSGTFLKDEPTFGDNSSIDIDDTIDRWFD